AWLTRGRSPSCSRGLLDWSSWRTRATVRSGAARTPGSSRSAARAWSARRGRADPARRPLPRRRSRTFARTDRALVPTFAARRTGGQVLRFLLWCAATGWLLGGGAGRLLRGGSHHAATQGAASGLRVLLHAPLAAWDWAPLLGIRLIGLPLALGAAQASALLAIRWFVRGRRRYV